MRNNRFKPGITYIVTEDFIRYGSELGYYLIPKGWRFVVDNTGNIRFPRYNYNLDHRVKADFIKNAKCTLWSKYLEELERLERDTNTHSCDINL